MVKNLYNLLETINYIEKNNEIQNDELLLNVKSGICFKHQMLVYIKEINKQLENSKSIMIKNDTKFEKSILVLKEKCRTKIAIDVDQVYVTIIYKH